MSFSSAEGAKNAKEQGQKTLLSRNGCVVSWSTAAKWRGALDTRHLQ